MSKKKFESDLFDFNIRYNSKDKNKPINTECVLEKKEELQQYYTGLYFEKCYHNIGRYKWFDDNDEYVYEGKLYANALHGYGRLIYPDHSTYEGLFFHNKKFGPGVVTYPTGLQDVGLWDGKYLVRLSQNIDLNDYNFETIPNVATTMNGKIYLLKYKVIIPLIDENDPVTNLAKKMKMNVNECQKLYSKCVRNYKSIFMNRSLYDKNFYTDPKELIIDVVDHFDENDEPVINEMAASSLIAWNNDKLYIEIMKHAFLNRKYEKITNYKIRNVFLPEKRAMFLPLGPIEEYSIKLLEAARDDDTVEISRLISDYDLYPNVMDCYGNTPMTYATITNKTNAIKTLVNLGANIDILNDEGVSSLMLCILNYLATKKDISVDNWETAFLKAPTDSSILNEGRVWPTGSGSSISEKDIEKSSKSSSTSEKKTKKQKMMSNKIKKIKMLNRKYIYNILYNPPVPVKSKISVRKKKTRKLMSASHDKLETLSNIMKTMNVLIDCGADVNSCELPFPLLISALFCQNVEMVKLLLESKANVNSRTRRDSGHLTPLHVACAMELNRNQEEIISSLLNYGAKVDTRNDINHWPEARDKILAGDSLEENDLEMGKTPFHVLAMRFDFDKKKGIDNSVHIVNIAKMLVEYGADVNELYLGHNVLSLAALHGNHKLMEFLLSGLLTNPNASLGHNMGVPLSMLTLKKYSKKLSAKELQTALETLIKYNANPFNEVPNFDGNALEFILANDKNRDAEGFKMLRSIAESVLRRYIDSRALQLIYNHQLRKLQHYPVVGMVVQYLNFIKAHKILQILLKYNKIPPTFELCLKLLNYVQNRTGKGRLKVYFIDKPEFRERGIEVKKKCTAVKFKRETMLVQIMKDKEAYELDFIGLTANEIANPYTDNMPEIDEDDEKYKICYGCLERNNKNLLLCPYCNIVYFCSVQCNLMKNDSGEHPCTILAYITEDMPKLQKSSKKRRRDSRVSDFSKFNINDVEDIDSLIDDTYYGDDDDDDDDDNKHYNKHSDGDDKDDDSYDKDETESHRLKRQQRSKSEKRRETRKEKKLRKLRRLRKIKRMMKRRRQRNSKWYIPKFNINPNIGRKSSISTVKGKLITIDFKEPLKEVERKMRNIYKTPELKHLMRNWSKQLKSRFPVTKNVELMLRVAKRVNLKLVPVMDNESQLNPCDPFDFKFWQLFLPYCVIQNGELYYRSNEGQLLYKFPYRIT